MPSPVRAAAGWSRTSSTNLWKTIQDDSSSQPQPSRTRHQPKEKPNEATAVIAERRGRLGLVIAEIGERNGIRCPRGISRAVMIAPARCRARAGGFGDFYRNLPDSLATCARPDLLDKVIDFILDLAKISYKTGWRARTLQGRRD